MKPDKFNNLKKEIARDLRALGGWVFYILVIARALIEPFRPFTDQLVIAGIIIILVSIFVKFDQYSSRALILLIFTSLFYNNLTFTIFATLVFFCLIVSSYALEKNKYNIALGLLIGIIVTVLAYYLPKLYLNNL